MLSIMRWLRTVVVLPGILLGAGARLGAQEVTHSQRLAPVVTSFGLGEKWRTTTHDALISKPEPSLWMMVRPSFDPDYSVELVRVASGPNGAPDTGFMVRWHQAKENIWFASMRPVDDHRLGFRPPAHIQTISQEAPLPTEVAHEVIAAWIHMLQETRYPKDSEFAAGMDGTDYEFYVWDPIHHQPMVGHVWSPEEGPTRMLVDLGEHLIAFTKAPENDRPALLKCCLDEAKSLQAYAYK